MRVVLDLQENNPDLHLALRTIFENSEIYVQLKWEDDVDQVVGYGQTFMSYKGSSRCELHLRVKQRAIDFKSNKKNWDEMVFMELLHGYGVFIKRDQSFSAGSSDIMSDYVFHVTDMSGLIKSITKYADELCNKQFTKALEDKLSED